MSRLLSCTALPFELAAALLHNHRIGRNVIEPMATKRSWNPCFLHVVVASVVLRQARTMAQYQFARINVAGAGSVGRALASAARFIAHHSLSVYNVHLVALILYNRQLVALRAGS